MPWLAARATSVRLPKFKFHLFRKELEDKSSLSDMQYSVGLCGKCWTASTYSLSFPLHAEDHQLCISLQHESIGITLQTLLYCPILQSKCASLVSWRLLHLYAQDPARGWFARGVCNGQQSLAFIEHHDTEWEERVNDMHMTI